MMMHPASPPSGPAENRRRAERVRPGPLRVRLHRTCEGILVDISETGALVQVPVSIAAEKQITLRLEVDDSGVELRARVVRSKACDVQLPAATLLRKEYQVGLDFSELTEQQVVALRRLIKSE